MAEINETYLNENYSSNGKANAGITLGIIGTALGALNSGLFSGSGILGLGGSNSTTAAAAGAMGASLIEDTKAWQLEKQEAADQQTDIYMIQQAKIDALKTIGTIREKDIAEKADIYRAAKQDINNNVTAIAAVKDYATNGIVDLYKVQVANDKMLYQTVDNNRYESMKNLADVYAASVKADKDLEIQIEKNRETDQAEKFSLYKDLSDKTNTLAYETLKQSYEDRIAASNQTAALAARVAQLETAVAVNSAQDPLMFQLAEARTQAALNTKVTGNLTVGPSQICGPIFPPPFPSVTTTGCSGTTTV